MAQRSSSQKTLLILSVLAIIASVFTLVASFLVINTWRQAGENANSAILIIGILLVASAVVGILMSVAGIRAANDRRKVMPAWWLAVIGLVIALVTFVVTFVSDTHVVSLGSLVSPIIFPLLVLYAANALKR